MNTLIAMGTFSFCVLISAVLYRYRAFLTQIFIIGVMSVWLWSMSMLVYSMNNKHHLWALVESQFSTVIESVFESLKARQEDL